MAHGEIRIYNQREWNRIYQTQQAQKMQLVKNAEFKDSLGQTINFDFDGENGVDTRELKIKENYYDLNKKLEAVKKKYEEKTKNIQNQIILLKNTLTPFNMRKIELLTKIQKRLDNEFKTNETSINKRLTTLITNAKQKYHKAEPTPAVSAPTAAKDTSAKKTETKIKEKETPKIKNKEIELIVKKERERINELKQLYLNKYYDNSANEANKKLNLLLSLFEDNKELLPSDIKDTEDIKKLNPNQIQTLIDWANHIPNVHATEAIENSIKSLKNFMKNQEMQYTLKGIKFDPTDETTNETPQLAEKEADKELQIRVRIKGNSQRKNLSQEKYREELIKKVNNSMYFLQQYNNILRIANTDEERKIYNTNAKNLYPNQLNKLKDKMTELINSNSLSKYYQNQLKLAIANIEELLVLQKDYSTEQKAKHQLRATGKTPKTTI